MPDPPDLTTRVEKGTADARYVAQRIVPSFRAAVALLVLADNLGERFVTMQMVNDLEAAVELLKTATSPTQAAADTGSLHQGLEPSDTTGQATEPDTANDVPEPSPEPTLVLP